MKSTGTLPVSKGSAVGAWVLVALFAVFGVGAAVMDGAVINGFVQQWRSESYPTAPATIIVSEIKTGHTSKGGTTYTPIVAFRYSVGDTQYTSSRRRHGQFDGSGKKRAETVVARYPVGGSTLAHYDPANPSDAILEPGISGGDVFSFVFAVPFNAIPIGGLAAALRGRAVISRRATSPGGILIWESGGMTRARLPSMFPPVTQGCVAAGMASFVALLAGGIFFDGEPPMWLSGLAAGAAAALGVAWGMRAHAREISGWRDLVFDPLRRVISLPPCVKGTLREVTYFTVNGIDYERGRASRNRQPSTRIVLRTTGGDARLAEVWNRTDAEAIGEWIMMQVKRQPAR